MKTLKVWQIGNLTLLLLLGLSSGAGTNAYAQELRDLFRQVRASVVTVRTIQREIKPQSKGEFVKTPGIGSGVLISVDGKVMTAAHIVQAADRVVVQFTEGAVTEKEVWAGDGQRMDYDLLALILPIQGPVETRYIGVTEQRGFNRFAAVARQ